MKLTILVAAAVLAGCATIVPPHQASNEDVCRNLAIPQYAPIAQQEAARRGLDCRPYFAQRAAQDAALNNAVQYFNRPSPPLPPPPTSIHCRTVYSGNTARTVCD